MPFDIELTTNIFNAPKTIITGFLHEQVSNSELFLHSYIPKFEPYASFSENQVEEPIFSILRVDIEEMEGNTKQEFQSISSVGDIINSETYAESYVFNAGPSVPLYFLEYSTQELEGLVYAKPIELQINVDEEITTAQKNYVNSIQAPEIEFDVLSSLGSIISEEAITDTTTTGTTTPLTTTTETITDVGGATATGERTFTAFDTSGNDDTSTATIGSY